MINNNENSKEYYVKKLEKYEELDMKNCQILIENIGKSTFGIGIILSSIPIAYVSGMEEINHISAVLSLVISGCMFISGSYITIKDLLNIANSIAKKVNCTNEINKIKAQLKFHNNIANNAKVKSKKIR